MGLLSIRIGATIIATIIAIIFAILSYSLKELSGLILTIEVILLPAIYIVGNYCAEHLIREKFDELLGELYDKAEKLAIENEQLKTKLSLYNDG